MPAVGSLSADKTADRSVVTFSDNPLETIAEGAATLASQHLLRSRQRTPGVARVQLSRRRFESSNSDTADLANNRKND